MRKYGVCMYVCLFFCHAPRPERCSFEGCIVQTSIALPFVWMWFSAFLPAGLPRSGKLPVLFLLTGQKWGFSPRSGDSFHRFRSNFAGPTGTWVRLAVQNLTSIGADGWECGPQNIKNFHFLVKSRPAGATPLTDFEIFWGLLYA